MLAYKGINGWYLLHPEHRIVSSPYTITFSNKKELDKYCKENKIEYRKIDVL